METGKTMTILGIAGSLRRASFNRGVLRAAQALVPAGAQLEIFDLNGIPGFNQDLGASVGMMGTARAQYHLRQIFVSLNMYPLNQPEVMIANASERFDTEGNLVDNGVKDRIRQLLLNLVTWTRQLQKMRM